jgi:hypothetical protein
MTLSSTSQIPSYVSNRTLLDTLFILRLIVDHTLFGFIHSYSLFSIIDVTDHSSGQFDFVYLIVFYINTVPNWYLLPFR